MADGTDGTGVNGEDRLMDLIMEYFNEYMNKYLQDTEKSDDDTIACYIAYQTLSNVLKGTIESRLSPSLIEKINNLIDNLTAQFLTKAKKGNNEEKGEGNQ